jgi:hypothetical protein
LNSGSFSLLMYFGALIHDDEHPMAFKNEGFAAEKIDTPQAALRVTEY